MTHLATVLVAADSSVGLAESVAERLARSGYRCGRVDSGRSALDRTRREQPDILIVGPSLSDMAPIALAKAAKGDAGCGSLPVVLLVSEPSAALATSAFEAGVDDLLCDPFDMAAMLPRIRPLLRVSTMRAELRHRSAVARALGLNAPDSLGAATAGNRPAVLLVGGDVSDLHRLVGGDAEVTVSSNVFEAEDLLAERNFDAAVAVPQDDVESHLDFCGQVRNNPRLFNLPVLLVDGGRGDLDVVDAYRRGATRVVRSPLDSVRLRCALMTLVRRQQLRWLIRDALARTLAGPTQDPATGLYGRDFLLRYLGHRLATAQSLQRHLSVLFFESPTVDSVRRQFGAEAADHLLVQLAQWIGGLLRGEDLTARFEGNEFCVVLPDTPLDEAEVVMQRIAGVLSCTDFAVREVYQPVKVWVRVGSADATPDDTIEGLIARARATLD